jgi:hypothetical protein
MRVYEYLPFLGIMLFFTGIAYFIFKQKMDEYNKKFSSIFQLLSAITDEITKLKTFDGNKRVEFNVNEVAEEISDSEDDNSDEDNSDAEVEDDDSSDVDVEDDGNSDVEDENSDHYALVGKEREPWDEEPEEPAETDKKIEINLDSIDYNVLTVKQLREMAKSRGLKGDVSKMKKNDLVDSLGNLTAV